MGGEARGARHARPRSMQELVDIRAAHTEWLLVAGGTDAMVPINFGRARPEGVIDLSWVPELAVLERTEHGVRIGAGVTFGRIEQELATLLPGLSVAARTVGSTQIRSVATIGGNLGTASPAGDAHPFLVASDAVVELRASGGARQVPCTEFFAGPGRTVLRPDEVIVAVDVPLSNDTSQQFSKVGPRNAMVIAVASVALVIDWGKRRVGLGMGSVGPVPLRARAAEELLATSLWDEDSGHVGRVDMGELARRVAGAAQPIDDVRGTAAYRRHAVGVMAQRCVGWALQERMEE